MSRIAILGAGAWGTALALSLHQRGQHSIALWSHRADHTAQLASARENTLYLPGFPIPPDILITNTLPEAIAHADAILCVTPSEHLRNTITRIAPILQPHQALVSASKGIEDRTFLRMSEVMSAILTQYGHKNSIAVLSGPSFAQEVAAGLPAALTIASADAALAQSIQRDFSSPALRLYRNDDVPGVELGGSLKNVIALAAGIVHGLNLGSNVAAALITRGIAEITRLAIACGGRRETLAGLSGIGDLVLTCTGSLSRNRTVGIELGKGRQLPDILSGLHGKVAEGIHSTAAALGLAARHHVEMPITEQMSAILHHGKHPKEAIRELMIRPGKDE